VGNNIFKNGKGTFDMTTIGLYSFMYCGCLLIGEIYPRTDGMSYLIKLSFCIVVLMVFKKIKNRKKEQ